MEQLAALLAANPAPLHDPAPLACVGDLTAAEFLATGDAVLGLLDLGDLGGHRQQREKRRRETAPAATNSTNATCVTFRCCRREKCMGEGEGADDNAVLAEGIASPCRL